jgi:hypothetical protein
MQFTLRRFLAAATTVLAVAAGSTLAAPTSNAACSTTVFMQVASKKIGASTLYLYENGCKNQYKGEIAGGLAGSKVKLRMNDGKATDWYKQPSAGVPAKTIALYAGSSVTRVYVDGYEVTKFGPVTGTLTFAR